MIGLGDWEATKSRCTLDSVCRRSISPDRRNIHTHHYDASSIRFLKVPLGNVTIRLRRETASPKRRARRGGLIGMHEGSLLSDDLQS